MMLDIAKIFEVGATIEKHFEVAPDDAVGNCSLSLQDLLSTQGSVARIIQALGDYCNARLPEGYVSVGLRFTIDQVAAAHTGTKVTLRAIVRRVENHTVTFDVELRDGEGVLVWAQNDRAVVNAQAIVDGAVARLERLQAQQG